MALGSSDVDRLILECESERIHLLGAIQSWGAMLVADDRDHLVRHASANLADFLGVAGADALGRTLDKLIEPAALARLLEAVARGHPSGSVALPPRDAAGRSDVVVSAHRLGDAITLEFERRPASGDMAPALIQQAGPVVAALRRATSLDALFAAATAELRRVTGFDQVLVYQFHADAHGHVVAEDRAPDVTPLLGLHFPAIDIPPQARRIFSRISVRLIGNSHAVPVRLLGRRADDPPPDLSLSALRSPSPCHLAYLRNMGSHATLTVGLEVEGALWGLLACHHRQPAHVPPASRALCELIGQVTALMVAPLRDAAARAAAIERRAGVAEIARRAAERRPDPADLSKALVADGADLLALCDAPGVIVRLDGRAHAFGDAPSGAAAGALVDALLARAPDPASVFPCESLAALFADNPPPSARDLAGALVLPVAYTAGDAIVWLRPEWSRILRWGGDPSQSIGRDAASGRSVPRGSFAAWRQEVRGRSLPWREQDHKAAEALRRQLDSYLAGYAETMRVARDEADRASRAKSEFLATMSHEIRSPISGLLGVLELLRGTALDAEQARMAEMVNNSANMLLSVLNDILDFSKIEAGAMSIQPEPVVPRRLLADLIHPHAVSASRRGLVVKLSVDDGVPEWISTDPLRVRQILGNLLSNAIKFTARGEVAVDVGGAATPGAPDGAAMLAFAVRDTGIGMTAEVLGRLFNPFTQADGSTTRNFGGTGLGLSISRRLAELLGGDLSVTSEPGVGSVFTLRIPLVACAGRTENEAGAAAAAVEHAAAAVEHAAPGGRVLVVDDDSTIRWLSQRQLEKLGFQVVVAENGDAGLRKLRGERFDVLLTDCHMPLMDGVALTQAVRADIDPALRMLPIIGLTADVTEAQREACHRAGMSELAIKPLTRERLAALMARHLSDAPDQVPAVRAEPPAPLADAAAEPPPVAFDPEIYLSIFDDGDPEGATWLGEYMAAARTDAEQLSRLLAALPADPSLRDRVGKLAHRLAGSSFSAGAMRFGTAARALEGGVLDGAAPDVLADLGVAVARMGREADAAIKAFLTRAPEALVS